MPDSTENHPKAEPLSTSDGPGPAQGSLIAEPEMGLRVSQAEFARIMEVSRTAVSRWVKSGKIRPDLDGRFCPKRAARSVLKSTDPNKIRARILKEAAEDAARLRADTERLQREVDEHEATIFRLRQVITRLERDQAEADRQMELAPEMLAMRWDDFADMNDDERTRAIAGVLDDALLSAANQIESEITARALGIDTEGPAATIAHQETGHDDNT